MKTTQNCLQEMVNAIKGVEPNEVAESKTTQTLLREIADAINNETTTDEGKNTQTLLGDITDAIRKSGGETFEVDITIDTDNDSQTITANKTYSQVMAAHASGKKIVINYNVTISSEYGVINELWYIGTFIDELGEHSDGSSCLVSGFGMDITYTQPSENRTKATSLLKWFDPAKVGTIYDAEFRLEDLNYESL